MSHPSRTRTRTRNRLYLVGVLPALLMLLVSGRIGLLLLDESSGLSAYRAEEYDAARADFAANQVLDPFEQWLAHFDEGTARHRADDLDGAVTAYDDALDKGVPADWECKVRNNLALAHEGIGDAALDEEGRIAAEVEWQTAREVLVDCLVDESASDPAASDDADTENDDKTGDKTDEEGDGEAGGELDPADTDRDGRVSALESTVVIDERLAAKLERRDPASAPTPTDPAPPAETLTERERRLEERDRRALEERRRLEQQREDQQDSRGGVGDAPPVPEW